MSDTAWRNTLEIVGMAQRGALPEHVQAWLATLLDDLAYEHPEVRPLLEAKVAELSQIAEDGEEILHDWLNCPTCGTELLHGQREVYFHGYTAHITCACGATISYSFKPTQAPYELPF